MSDIAASSSVEAIVARIERLPTSWWQIKARIIVGIATFFDAFDALAIASVLPVIAPLWKLAPTQIGWLISAGFVGQLVGALVFGWIAEQYGRMTAMVWSIALFSVMSLVCALAWDYSSFLVFRTIQGIGLGGEVPVAAVFISELAKAQGRGRFVLLYELVFPIGLVAASLVGLWVVPHLGWQYMFVIGALPGFLALALRRLLPESPRWLAVRGRFAEAEAAMALIETETQRASGNSLPAPKLITFTLSAADYDFSLPRLPYLLYLLWSLSPLVFFVVVSLAVGAPEAAARDVANAFILAFAVVAFVLAIGRFHDVGRSGWWSLLLSVPIVGFVVWLYLFFAPSAKTRATSPYLRRTLVVWVIWFSAYFVNYGLSIWLPTVYRIVFKLPLEQSLRYGLITQAVGLVGTLICALAIDHVGRRPWFALAFVGAAASLAVLASYSTPSAEQVLLWMTIAYFFVSSINIGVYLYTPELYPTRMRALGVGTATAWLRLASIIGPAVVGMTIASGLQAVFVTFAAVACYAAIITGLSAVETKGRVLEEASP